MTPPSLRSLPLVQKVHELCHAFLAGRFGEGNEELKGRSSGGSLLCFGSNLTLAVTSPSRPKRRQRPLRESLRKQLLCTGPTLLKEDPGTAVDLLSQARYSPDSRTGQHTASLWQRCEGWPMVREGQCDPGPCLLCGELAFVLETISS